jgi:alanyl-tRNA synthetase
MTAAEIRQSFFDFFREKDHSIVPSASLLPDSPNLLFTNAGMNQFVPIFLGQQKPSWNPPRVADTQKCIRAGGKHNDLDDVGLDTYHHTFFEMLGNWSFGDYFKKEAIEWAWELVVERWKLPASRLYATVYRPGPGEPSEFDQEAHDHWARLFEKAGLDPAVHVVDGNKKDNFWMMGDTGPCGPCSELHVDLTPAGDTKGSLVNAGDARCIEIWNLVFIQFNANADGTFSPLPQRHVDTGMGLERITAMIQGTKNFTDFTGIVSNYETDVFHPIFDELAKLSGKKYTSTLPPPPGSATVPVVGEGVSPSRTLPAAPPSEESSSRRDTATNDRDGRATQIAIDIAFRVIADHIRTLSFAIADGIQPSNEGRGYVLRRILRRAVRYGRTLGFHEPFFYGLVDVLAQTMGGVFPELRAKQNLIKETLRREEEAFNKTLDRGIELFEKGADSRNMVKSYVTEFSWALPDFRKGIIPVDKERVADLMLSLVDGWALTSERGVRDSEADFIGEIVNSGFKVRGELTERGPLLSDDRLTAFLQDQNKLIEKLDEQLSEVREKQSVLPGAFAFRLYDTYGFPLDLTELMARERGFTVDVAGFEKLMDEQRIRARAAQKKTTIELIEEIYDTPTEFVGFENVDADASFVGLQTASSGAQFFIFDRTPFYAEMGGQVGDRGRVRLSEGKEFAIKNTIKRNAVFWHQIDGASGQWAPFPGTPARLQVDQSRRRAIERHHTVTHLLHWALHERVSKEATQKGSYVGPEKLTFDFSSAGLTAEQKRGVEKLVNEKIAENAPVSWTEIPYAEAKKRSDIQQFFGDKYGDLVRVVQIGGEPGGLNGFSMELCGGTHVRATGDIGSFRIVREEAIAAGIRRIEAVAGEAAKNWAREEAARQQEKFEALARKKSGVAMLSTFAENAETTAMLKQIDERSAHLEKLEAEVHEWQKQQAKASDADLKGRAAEIAKELRAAHGTERAIVASVPDADGKMLQGVVDALKSHFSGPIFLAGAMDGRVALIASVPKELVSQFQANKLIQEIAPIVAGKGGGRPDNAQGAGKDVAKIDDALARARALLL